MSKIGSKKSSQEKEIVSATLTYEEILQVALFTPGDHNRRGLNVLFEGSPGQAKTSFTETIAAKMGFHTVKFLLSQCEAAELVGMPYLADDPAYGKVTKYAPQAWFKELAQAGPGVLFLDELSLGKEDTQNAALTMLTHGTVGNFSLGQNVAIIGAQNKAGQVGGNPPTPAMSTRWIHIHWDGLPFDVWEKYLVEQPKWYQEESRSNIEVWKGNVQKVLEKDQETKQRWLTHFPEAINLVCSFLSRNPDLRHKMPAEGSDDIY